MSELRVAVGGMTCSSCARAIEKKLQGTIGILRAAVNLIDENACILYDEKLIKIEQIIRTINSLGFKTSLASSIEQQTPCHSFTICIILAITEFLVCMILPAFPLVKSFLNHKLISSFRVTDFIEFSLTTPVQYIIGTELFSKSLAMIQENSYSMDVLIFVATTCAYLYSVTMIFLAVFDIGEPATFFEASSTLLAFTLVSKKIEQKAKQKMNFFIQNLSKTRPRKARLVQPEFYASETFVDIEDIRVDDYLKIMPGESIPVDGIIVNGASKLNESVISGESRPQSKKVGDAVYAGALNLHSPFILQTTSKSNENFIEKILQLIKKSQSSKTVTQLHADSIARYFIPGILALSALTFLTWITVFFYYDPSELGFPTSVPSFLIALKFGIAVLVVACPCSLTLAVPTANAIGIGLAAENGILVKGGQTFENGSSVDYAIFDKTGTLTTGYLQLQKFKISDTFPKLLVNNLIYMLEKESEHYCAPIICDYIKRNFLLSKSDVIMNEFHKESGCGILGGFTLNRISYNILIGRISWILENSANNQFFRDNYLEIEGSLCSGSTVVGISINQIFTGFIAMNDSLKKDAEKCIINLSELSIQSAIISGDSLKTVRYIANQLGISMFFSEVSPTGKISIVKSLQRQSIIAMIGDGINDSPALSQSNVGIAVCNGTDLAIKSADVILIKDGLWRIPYFLTLSRIVHRTIFLNFFISFSYNLITLPIASGMLYKSTGIILHPLVGAVSMALSSLSVVLSSIAIRFNPHLKRFK